ncbi:MAG: hypothetical protein J5601_05890 [Elusimicrobiaceae bacterium]|nr:hypothetical protein [Elusimicrobiaceae bacterium]
MYGITRAELLQNVDVLDPVTKQFRTLPAHSTVDLPTPDVLGIHNHLQNVHDTQAVAITTQRLQQAALNSPGVRTFFFPEELYPLSLLDTTALSAPILAARKEAPGYGIFVQLTKPLVIFQEEKEAFKAFPKGGYFFIDSANEVAEYISSTPSNEGNTFSGITKTTLFKMLENDTQHFFFEEPYTYVETETQTTYHLYRANFQMALEGRVKRVQSFVSKGDYLSVNFEDKSFQIMNEKEANKLLKQVRRSHE